MRTILATENSRATGAQEFGGYSYYMAHSVALFQGDVLETVRKLPDNSIDGCLCDPPYGFSFMGKKWDYSVPSVETWAEILRVLKPGAPLLSFGGPRTYHRLAVGIEDAGFHLRDQLMWVFGKGFPKSQNISLALDKSVCATRKVVGTRVLTGNAAYKEGEASLTASLKFDAAPTVGTKEVPITEPATELAKTWNGYGTALKPAFEPICLARKPTEGTMADNVTEWSVGGLNIDGCRIGRDPSDVSGYATTGSKAGENLAMGRQYDRAAKPDAEGRWPANLLFGHSPECRVVATTGEQISGINRFDNGAHPFGGASGEPYTKTDERYVEHDVFECVEGCPVRMLDESTGVTKSVPFRENTATGSVLPLKKRSAGGYSDKGGASRFFYSAKVSTKEREYGCEQLPRKTAGEMVEREEDSAGIENPRTGAGRTGGARNHHPTLKPISLTTWLAKLILPPSPTATLLVPFCGSGSEIIGALLAGWPCVFGIDSDPEYHAIARARIAAWVKGVELLT